MADEVVTPVAPGDTPAIETPAAAPVAPVAPEKPDGEPARQDSPKVPLSRLQEETRKRRDAERELEWMKRQQPQPTPSQPQDPSPPKWEDYERQGKSAEQFNMDVVSHIAEHKARQLFDDERKRVQDSQNHNAFEDRKRGAASNFEQKSLEARSRFTDFDSSIQAMDDAGIRFPDTVALLIAESDQAADLAYHLAKNPEEAFKLSSMPVEKAIFQLGRIESTLSKGNGSPVKTTNTPAPVIPVASDSPSKKLDWATMPQEEYNRRKNGFS